jgi:HPt (histidine-containing phosphotransfer) domain-containing protein
MTACAKPSDEQEPPGARPGSPVFDFAGGLARVMGDRNLFLQVLERFCKDYGNSDLTIRAALANDDRPLALRITHTLKGAAGMIEAQSLHRQTSALEKALRSDNTNEAKEVDLLEAELRKVLRALRSVMAGSAPSGMQAGAASPVPETQAPLQQLRELLLAGDGAALDLLEEASTSLAGTLGEARYNDLAAAVDEFDFARALTLLDRSRGFG